MNLLVTYRELDVAGYDMLGRLSQDSSITIYIAVASEKDKKRIQGKCIPVLIPALKSKFVWKAIKELRKIMKQYHIDIVFSPSSAGLSNALFASWGTKVKNVGYRGTQAKVKKGDPTYYLATLNPRVDHIVCETEDIYTYLSQVISKNKLSVNLKPFDVNWVKDACTFPKQVEGIPENAITCVYIGSCKGRPFKGLTCLVNAFHLLNNPKVHLIFIGDYDEKDYQLAKSGVAADRIHFLGQRDDAIYFLPKQDIFILPSLRDASPRVIREAMACGLPCIVSDIPGARDLVVNGVTGILIPSNSPQELSLAIQSLIDDEEKRKSMGKAGLKHIIEDFSVEDYVDKFRETFQSLI